MIIQHNLLAANANRSFTRINEKKEKWSEKLASGYRINRAADDAAGLSISEKMRSQIRGLHQASANAQDGMSLIQTAEGALSEIHSMVQRMRELSVGAANDTNVAEDRKAIQEEMNALTKEIDNIAANTEFNTKKLLDGSCSGSGISESSKDEFIKWLNGTWLNDAASKIENITGWTLEPDTTLNITFKDIGGSAVATMSGWYLGDDLTFTVNTNFLTDGMTYNGTDGPTMGGIPADRLVTHEMTHGYMFDNVSATAAPDNWFIEGLAEAVHGASDIRYGAYELGGSINYAAINTDIQNFDFAGNQGGYDTYTVGYIAVSYLYNQIETATPGGFKAMMTEMDESDQSFHSLVQEYTGKTFTTFISDMKTAAQTQLTNGTFNTGFLDALCGIDINDGDADPLGGGDASSSNVIPNANPPLAPTSSTTSLQVGANTISVVWDSEIGNSGIVLQIGAQSGQSMTVSIEAATASALGIDGISVSNNANAGKAITICDNAIKTVSAIRSNLGAYQNRLEHVIANLDNVAENTQNAESRIRDTDMAEAMVEYSKYNILAQAGQAMISQANQNPQGILELLQ